MPHWQVFGYHHPKTERARKTLERPQYKRIKRQIEEERRLAEAQNNEDDEDSEVDDVLNTMRNADLI